MIKPICFLERRPGLSRDAAREHRLHHDGPLVADLVFPDESRFLVQERARWILSRAPDVNFE